MRCTIDRVEEGIAVLIPEDDHRLQIMVPAGLLPSGYQEGDVLTLTIRRDPAATAAAKERVSGLIEEIQKK